MKQENKLKGFFENFLKKEFLFKDKKVLQSNYDPESIPHRDTQIEQIANILGSSLMYEKPSNLFIYGKTGTGKTLSARYVTNNLLSLAKERNITLETLYINCKLKKIADTEYRLIAELIRLLGGTVPSTGLPTEEVYRIFTHIADSKKQLILIILDEIDQLVEKTGDEILYSLTRMNSELKNAQISLIGISNNLVFTDNLDPRVKSSLSEEEIVFPPYNALQLQDILNQRAKSAFKQDVIEVGVIEKCAAYAAREHGDARRALELLRVSGEIAERSNETTVKIKHIDEAEDKIEKDRVLDIITTQPKQHQAILYSIMKLGDSVTKDSEEGESLFTGDIYELYKNICGDIHLRPLTQRRVSDIIAELDMLGIITGKVISKGRYGRTRKISLAIHRATKEKAKDILERSFGFT
ncbi:MAG TPA: ORC1-type DNA replication protein [Candidatus Nanoarchaeia archaeon]|nr:ORC1-type DNA replication protein [Candidatus Nanoarchaeia archaeon]